MQASSQKILDDLAIDISTSLSEAGHKLLKAAVESGDMEESVSLTREGLVCLSKALRIHNHIGDSMSFTGGGIAVDLVMHFKSP